MNVENMLRVADAIEEETLAKFNMASWVAATSYCGTVACVAGFATLLEPSGRISSWFGAGSRILDLSEAEAEELFYGGPYDLAWLTKQKKLVPDAIRWMALTRNVSWRRALEAAKCVSKSKRDR